MGVASLIPVVCSLISFVLAILGLFAGNTPGFLESNQVILFNTSALGRNFVPSLAQATTTSTTTATRDLSSHEVVLVDGTAAEDAAADTPARRRLEPRLLTLEATEGVLAGLPAATAADKMAGVLGIHEFYALHAMTLCEGEFAPNATAGGAGAASSSGTAVWRNVTGCSAPLRGGARGFNVTARLEMQLAAHLAGGCGTSADGTNSSCLLALGASQPLLDTLNGLPSLALVLAVFYILGAAGAGLALLLAGVSLATGGAASPRRREIVLGNAAAAAGGALALLVAALVLTIAAASTVRAINRQGEASLGLQAALGQTFLNMTWAAFALVMIAALYWLGQMHADTKKAAAKAAAKK